MGAIEGKVAAIRNPYTIIINKGYVDGVEEGMRFVIYYLGDEIIDPDTQESLGKFEYVKAKVRTTYVSEKFSIAETYSTASSFDMLIPRPRPVLPLDEDLKANFPDTTISNVRIGDLVRQILD